MGETTADTALRIRSAYACPSHRMCNAPAGTPATPGAPAAAAPSAGGTSSAPAGGGPTSAPADPAVDGVSYADAADVDADGGLSWWQVLLATALAIALLGVLFVSFASLKLRNSLSPLRGLGLNSAGNSGWAAAVLGEDEDGQPGFGRSHPAMAAYDTMEYRAI